MVRLWQALNHKSEVLMEDVDEGKVRAFWSATKEATQLKEVTSYQDEIKLLDLLARAGDKTVEKNQQEDGKHPSISSALQGCVT